MNYQQNDTLQKGFFTVNPEFQSIFESNHYETLFLTNNSNITLKNRILTAIREAKSVVKLCSFIVTDEEIVNEILLKVQDPNIAVFLLTQLDQRKLTNNFALASNVQDEENFSTLEITSHLDNIKMLRDKGVHVRATKDLHAKFIVSDRNIGLIMSANFTANSLSINVESGVDLDIASSQDLDRLFDLIYLQGTSYRSFMNTKKDKKMFVLENNITLSQDNLALPTSGLRYTYDNFQHNLLEEVIKIIDSAENFIFLSTYSIVSLTKIPQFVNAVSRANARNVEIAIFCRAMNYRFDHVEGCRVLSRLGCKIFGDYYNHSKGIITEKTGMIFTANIDGNYGLNNSFEVGYILSETQRKDFLEFHKELIDNCNFIFSPNPTRGEFMNFVAHYEMEKNLSPFLLERDLEILVKKSLQAYFENVSDCLMFIGKKKDKGAVTLFLNFDDNFFIIKKSGSKLILQSKCPPLYNAEKYFLKFFNLKITFSNE
ncbi:MAG: phospholipase D-like domain-containing protein [Chryseobacterium sp.]|uniref:phospholipase D-like domain-containing protein n=1 Tax=Chryseobacterium lactis TaxID=1241981 RepID=UPI00162A0F31|nr:phospholipase D-like domain-containing protein [Chryseobacterium lactis]MDN5479166.1 phospholipase D-like domain-containing protein [Chryseobacterium sp.]